MPLIVAKVVKNSWKELQGMRLVIIEGTLCFSAVPFQSLSSSAYSVHFHKAVIQFAERTRSFKYAMHLLLCFL